MEYKPSYSDFLYADIQPSYTDSLTHHGVKGMKWGVRRYQNKDGSLTRAGRERMHINTRKAAKQIGKAALGVAGGLAIGYASSKIASSPQAMAIADKVVNGRNRINDSYSSNILITDKQGRVDLSKTFSENTDYIINSAKDQDALFRVSYKADRKNFKASGNILSPNEVATYREKAQDIRDNVDFYHYTYNKALKDLDSDSRIKNSYNNKQADIQRNNATNYINQTTDDWLSMASHYDRMCESVRD